MRKRETTTKGVGEAGQGKAEIEIRFSVDRYNPAPVPASQTVQSGLLDPNIPVETSDITATGQERRLQGSAERRDSKERASRKERERERGRERERKKKERAVSIG